MKTVSAIVASGMLLFMDVAWARPKPAEADLKVIQACLERQDQGLGVKCIGIVADPCIAAANNDTGKAKACAARELAVWEGEMAAALKRVSAGGFKDIGNAATQTQKAWQSSHRKLCAVFDKTDPGMLPGASTYCRLHETASRALVLRRLGEAVSEH